jgi:phosphomevalonate kinase
VLDGATAVVSAVDRRVAVTIEVLDAPPWRVAADLGVPPAGGGTGPLALLPEGIAREAFAAALANARLEPEDLPPLAVTLKSGALHLGEGGAKLGLGSSAAVAVALAAALRRLLERLGLAPAPPPGSTFPRDVEVHRRSQGDRGSGIDVAASTHGGLLAYRLADGIPEARPLRAPPDLAHAVFWTGRSASTRDFLARVAAARAADRSAYERRLSALAAAAEDGVRALEAARTPAFLEAVAAFAEGLRALGAWTGAPIVSGPHAALARLAGAVGAVYKPSGAGGGDVGVAFGSSPDALDRLEMAAAGAGFARVGLLPDPRGVVTTDDVRPT